MTEVRKMGKYTSVVTAEAIRESQHRVTKTRLGEFHGVQLIADNMLDQRGLGDQSIRIKKNVKLLIEIARLITERNLRVINLHIGLSTIERDQVMDGFQSGSSKVLITTNVLAHGIDVLQVNLVINYDLPVDYSGRNPDYETYLHTSYRPYW
ncbi:15610_t:CDS:2 [Entrophospora sp. SA101]|nr:15610_t:CDS:2 [Entrophospora sp. SA101]CAJ0825853.1 11808_t:CDS:2 [Entrophospora sp. SA101]CAJ0830662.1 22417_t:CDS:2 [Entrophospora sp. SA101]